MVCHVTYALENLKRTQVQLLLQSLRLLRCRYDGIIGTSDEVNRNLDLAVSTTEYTGSVRH